MDNNDNTNNSYNNNSESVINDCHHYLLPSCYIKTLQYNANIIRGIRGCDLIGADLHPEEHLTPPLLLFSWCFSNI